MGCRFISTDTASKIGLGTKQHGGKSSKKYLTCEEMLVHDNKTVDINNLKVETEMSQKNYRLDKVVDCCRIYAASATKTTNGLDEKISKFLDSLKKLGNSYSIIEEDSLLSIINTLTCKRAITTEVMLISQTKGKYKKITYSEITNFISEQGKSGILSQCKHCNEFFIVITKDHIFPRSKGGIDHHFNMQDMCYFCNTKKSDIVENKPFIEVYYNKECKFLLPVYQAKKLGLALEKASSKGKVYADNPHILTLPNLT